MNDSSPPPTNNFAERIGQHHLARREFVKHAIVGTAVCVVGGGLYVFADDKYTEAAKGLLRPDGKPRLPPDQRVLRKLRPMGGTRGNANRKTFQLRVHGEVKKPFTLNYKQLLAMPQVERASDVHCVTGWSVLDAVWKGVTVAALAEKAQILPSARHVIIEGAHGYTANIPLADALKPNVMVSYRLDGKPLARRHGAPVRAVVPDLYFWKSTKWLTGIRFVTRDKPGFWEVRGYHNHADPWLEERYG